MFEKKSKRTLAIQSLLGADMAVYGDIEFHGGLRIDGKLEGDIRTRGGEKALLVVSETGVVQGSVLVEHAVISGTIEGPIVALELLELHPTAKVCGDVRYKALEMHPGAVVYGTLHHDSNDPLGSNTNNGNSNGLNNNTHSGVDSNTANNAVSTRPATRSSFDG